MIVTTKDSRLRVFENELLLEKDIVIPKTTVIKATVDGVEKSLTLGEDMIGMYEYGDYIKVDDITHELKLVKRMSTVIAHPQILPKGHDLSHVDYLDEIDPQVDNSTLAYVSVILPQGHLSLPKARVSNFNETEEPCGIMSMNIKGNVLTLGVRKDMVEKMTTVKVYYHRA